MYRLEYEDEFCRKLESFFVNENLAYSWIKYQRNLRQWMLFDEEDRVVDCYTNPNAD